ncbi:MAG: TlpA family protein disulfide reductase [Chitinophagaceae bacterium]|nr:TlpA family protein disulfide reductase [Polaromonas sp.]
MLIRIALVLCTFLALSVTHAQTVGEKAALSHVDLFDGTRFDPKSIEGKPTLVYFWASWCPICRKEMPTLEKRFQTYKDKGFNVIAINFRDKPEKAMAMVDSVKPISFPVGAINDSWRSDYPKLYGTPTWMLLDKKGIIRKVVMGQEVITGGWRDGLEEDLKKVIAEGN